MTSLGLFEEISCVFSATWYVIRDKLRRKLEQKNEKKRMEEMERASVRKGKNAAKRARKRKNKVCLAPISLEWQEKVQYKQCPVDLFLASRYLEHESKFGKEKQVEVILEHDKASTANKSVDVEGKEEMAVETANKRGFIFEEKENYVGKFHEDQNATRDVKDCDEWDSRLDDFSVSNTSVNDNPLEYTNKKLERVKMDSIAQKNAIVLKNILKDCGAASLQDIVAATKIMRRG